MIRCGEPLPRVFHEHPDAKGLLAECDIGILGPTGHVGRLRVKALFFDTQANRRRFGRALGCDWSGLAAVNDLGFTVEKIDKRGNTIKRTRHCDPRYACIMAFSRRHLSMEIICHESVHAADFIAKRSTTKWPGQDECPAEAICYPAGRIAAAINRFAHDNGLYA